MSKRKHGTGARGAIFEALSGRRGANVGEGSSRDLRGMLLAAFGSSSRDPQRPDTRAAAQGLGVTVRTVNRWLARADQQHTAPRANTLQQIRGAAQAAVTTKAGRVAAVAQARSGALGSRGMSITVRGVMGPSDDPDYTRRRKAVWNLGPQDTQALLSAYESHGENGALQYLTDNPHLYGMDSWHFGDVQGFDVRPLYGQE